MLILDETQKYIEKGKGDMTASSMDPGDENDEELEVLCEFR